MLPIWISIAFTTGACAFLFFVLPYIDGKKSDRLDGS